MRVNVTLSPRAHALLTKEAARRGSSLAEVIRRAAEHYWDGHITAIAEGSLWCGLRREWSSWVLVSPNGRRQPAIRVGDRSSPETGERCVCCGEGLHPPRGNDLRYSDNDPAGPFWYVCETCADILLVNQLHDEGLASLFSEHVQRGVRGL